MINIMSKNSKECIIGSIIIGTRLSLTSSQTHSLKYIWLPFVEVALSSLYLNKLKSSDY